jgi:hypothetical protein
MSGGCLTDWSSAYGKGMPLADKFRQRVNHGGEEAVPVLFRAWAQFKLTVTFHYHFSSGYQFCSTKSALAGRDRLEPTG